jgi:phage replication-related protein YjqB (UPF0714/DUF867 family)
MRSHSLYKNFAELRMSESEGFSYRVTTINQGSAFAIVAPHGGGIEPGTSEIARGIAGTVFSYYTFDGLMQDSNELLHITSTLFDEPKCLRLVNDSDFVVAIHGCGGDQMTIYVGGLYEALKIRLINSIVTAGFEARLAGTDYAGNQLQNICNRGRSGKGVQLEISRGLRRVMFKKLDRRGRKITTDVFKRFVASVREVLMFVAEER